MHFQELFVQRCEQRMLEQHYITVTIMIILIKFLERKCIQYHEPRNSITAFMEECFIVINCNVTST